MFTTKPLKWLLAAALASNLVLAQGAPATSGASDQKAAGKPWARGPDKLDINTAAREQLEALGLSSATAQRIIDNRPYRAKNQLVQRGLISRATYEKIREQIIAHRVKSETGARARAESKR